MSIMCLVIYDNTVNKTGTGTALTKYIGRIFFHSATLD